MTVSRLIRQFMRIEERYFRWPDGQRRFGVRPEFRWDPEHGPADMEQLLRLTLRILHALGPSLYAPPRNEYERYMQSPEWDARRLTVLKRGGYGCELCKATGVRLTVAHLTYERLGAELDDDLIALCDPCHQTLDGIITDPEVAGMAVPR